MSCEPNEQYKHGTYLNQKSITETSQKKAQVELGSAKVQAVERVSIGWHFLQTVPSLSILLFSIYKG
jgi:hypothetical protein